MNISQLAKLYREEEISRDELINSGRTKELMAFFVQEAKSVELKKKGNSMKYTLCLVAIIGFSLQASVDRRPDISKQGLLYFFRNRKLKNLP